MELLLTLYRLPRLPPTFGSTNASHRWVWADVWSCLPVCLPVLLCALLHLALAGPTRALPTRG